MSFPSSPTNGQIATVANVTYQYSSSDNTWTRQLGIAGNISLGNITATGFISATGNITGDYILGNGSQLTGITTDAFRNILVSGESNVESALTPNIAFVAGTDIAITTDAANGTITFNYSSSASIFATGGDMGSVDSAVTSSQDLGSVVDSATVFYDLGSVANNGTFTELTVTGNISAAGNITGSYILGNGSQLTGLPAGYGNANLANIGANSISTTGNISGGYLLGNGSQLTGISSGNSSVNITVTEITANTTIATGQNGFSVGPMSTADGVQVSIADGQRWVII